MTSNKSKKSACLLYVKHGEVYIKQPITLFDLIARLSEKRSQANRYVQLKLTHTSEKRRWTTSPTKRDYGKTTKNNNIDIVITGNLAWRDDLAWDIKYSTVSFADWLKTITTAVMPQTNIYALYYKKRTIVRYGVICEH